MDKAKPYTLWHTIVEPDLLSQATEGSQKQKAVTHARIASPVSLKERKKKYYRLGET